MFFVLVPYCNLETKQGFTETTVGVPRIEYLSTPYLNAIFRENRNPLIPYLIANSYKTQVVGDTGLNGIIGITGITGITGGTGGTGGTENYCQNCVHRTK